MGLPVPQFLHLGQTIKGHPRYHMSIMEKVVMRISLGRASKSATDPVIHSSARVLESQEPGSQAYSGLCSLGRLSAQRLKGMH